MSRMSDIFQLTEKAAPLSGVMATQIGLLNVLQGKICPTDEAQISSTRVEETEKMRHSQYLLKITFVGKGFHTEVTNRLTKFPHYGAVD